jgi:hypothetical protein
MKEEPEDLINDPEVVELIREILIRRGITGDALVAIANRVAPMTDFRAAAGVCTVAILAAPTTAA